MRTTIVVAALLSLSLAGVARAQSTPGADAFSKLGALSGNWSGSFEWSDGRKGPMDAHYYLSGNGSALVEDLIQEGTPGMTSVYHLDGPDLRVTHYCAAGNQPRLKAKSLDLAHGQFDFEMVDITNLRSPDAGHVTALTVHLIDPEHVSLVFRFEGGGRHSLETVTLKRVKVAA